LSGAGRLPNIDRLRNADLQIYGEAKHHRAGNE
jgi:hypothetical protein